MRGVRCTVAAVLLILTASSPAQSVAEHPVELPPPMATALREAHIPAAALGAVVTALDGGTLGVSVNPTLPMSPASTMKLVTTYAALDLLGPAYQWHTTAYASARPHGGRLDGNLILRGGGDPSLVIERFWMLVHRLRGLGVRQIQGDLVLDKSLYEGEAAEAASLDGNDLRPYNVAPDALLVNFKTLSLEFIPDPGGTVAHVVSTPVLAGLHLPATVPLAGGACGDWHERLAADFGNPWAPVFRGRYPRDCAERTWNISLLGHTQFVGAVFRALWQASGGTWNGHVRDGRVPPDAIELLDQESAPLSEVVHDVNKFSNNVMARQVFLTLGAPEADHPVSSVRSIQAISDWLARIGLPMPELVLENGCGLSRRERISADSLARLLRQGYQGPHMAELMSSLPITGTDGTMKNRHTAQGSAHVKTGYLDGVRAVAGYVLSASGHRYVVVAIVNHPNAENATAALDSLLDWVQQQG